jgi:hypothetical protein
MILWFAAAVGIISFLVRIVFPIGWILTPGWVPVSLFFTIRGAFFIGPGGVEKQLAGYIPLSIKGKRFARYAPRLLLFLAVISVLEKIAKTPQAWFTGGLALAATAVRRLGAIIGLFNYSRLVNVWKKLWNKSSVLMGKLSRNAFAVYIFHPLVLIALALLFRNWGVDPAIKFLVVAPLGDCGQFFVGFGGNVDSGGQEDNLSAVSKKFLNEIRVITPISEIGEG